mgnify:CR=1 FL=1
MVAPKEDIFPSRRQNKLITQGECPFKVLERIEDNAYNLELPVDTNANATFNMGDPAHCVEENLTI